MTTVQKPLASPLHGLSAAHRLPGLAAIKTAVLVALLIAYGLGFAALYPLVQASVAKSAAEGNAPMLFVGP